MQTSTMCVALLISVRNVINSPLFCTAGGFAISEREKTPEQLNDSGLRVRPAAQLMSSLNGEEGEPAVQRASQKKQLESRGMVSMSSFAQLP